MPKFESIISPGVFLFSTFIADDHPTKNVNCYDCAWAVHTMINLTGGNSALQQMRPVGYINTVNLIGVGQCNNPFKDLPRTVKDPVVPAGTIDDRSQPRKRTQFSTHSFVLLDGKIFDATAGPKTGTEGLSDYLNSLIDKSTDALKNAAGKEENVSPDAIRGIE